MRTLQRNLVARLLVALTLSALVTVAAWRAGPPALAGLAIVALTVVGFIALTVAPDAIALRRGHHWRWWWRSSDDEGPFWPGTRIPRAPRPPR